MREIKFRVYHNLKGLNPVYGFDKKYVYLDNYDSPEYLENILPIEQCELEQFTGLKDKNGKEIYEGDIVRILFGHSSNKQFDYEIVFWEGSFALKQIRGEKIVSIGLYFFHCVENDIFDNYLECNGSVFELIGNIHEAKELPKDTKNQR